MTRVTAGQLGHVAGPYLERRRADWAELAATAPMTLDAATLERLRGRLKAHCEQDHQPWPARSRHVRHTGDGHAKRRRQAFDGDVQHLSPSEQITLTRPRLRLLNPDTGELLDCHD